MQEADLAAADRLTRLAGWNQIEGDWRTWLKLPEARAWVTEIDGRVVGSTTAIPYENRFGWVMVLGDRVGGLPRSGLWLQSIRERRVS